MLSLVFRRLASFAGRTAIVLIVLALAGLAAHAQAIGSDAAVPAGGTVVATNSFTQILLAFLAVVLPSLGSYIAWLIQQRTKIQKNSAAAQAVDTAAADGTGLAYKLLAQFAAANIPHTVEIQNAVVAAGVQYALAAAGDSAKVREETGASLGQMIAGKLGTLMAQDPNITIGPPAPLAGIAIAAPLAPAPAGPAAAPDQSAPAGPAATAAAPAAPAAA